METETSSTEETKPLPVPQSRWDRLLYALIVIVLPIVCFSLIDLLKPDWQSGQISDYVRILLLPRAAWFFFPFLIYSLICLLLLLVAPKRFAAYFTVRFGVYTGIVLAFQYIALALGTYFGMVGAISAGILILSKWIYSKIKPKWRIGYLFILLVLVFTTALILWHPSLQTESLTSFFTNAPFGILIAILAASPGLCFAVMTTTSVKLFKIYEIRRLFLFWPAATLIAWLAAYAFAWRFSVLQAVEIYHSLPTSPPNCYIATASARGHKRIVHAKMLATTNGAVWVTTQLQVLKCGELALMALAPRFHHCLRAVYDVFGYALAKRLTNPFLADLAYLMLKPFEWTTILTLKAIVPEINEYVRPFYNQE